MARKQKMTREEWLEERLNQRLRSMADDPLTIVYVPWEEGPMGKVTPKPEGYDKYYQDHGMSFYDTKDL